MLTFELQRLSSTPDVAPNLAREFEWTHRSGELLLVFDTFRSGGQPSEVMRIMQASQTLYDIPLQDLIAQGKRLAEVLTQHGAEVVGEQLPCSGIAKSPMLGIRYALSHGVIRRLQVRFASSEGYDQAINHVRHLGLHFSAARPITAVLKGRPKSPQSYGGSITCPPSQLSELSNRPCTAVSTPSSLQTHSREASVTRPSTAQPRYPSPLRDQVYSARPDSAASTVSLQERNDLSNIVHQRTSSATRPETPLAFARPSIGELPPRRELPFQRTDSPTSSRGSDTARPNSRAANAFMGPPLLPPPSHSGNVRPNSRAKNSSGSDLPPLPEPTIIPNIHSSPMKKPSLSKRTYSRQGSQSSRPMSAMPAEKEHNTFSSPPVPLRPSTSYGLSSIRPLSAISEADQNERQCQPHGLFPTPPASDAVEQNIFDSDHIENLNNGGSSLSAYALQSDEGRMAALNERLFQYLEDPDFIRLLGDVETSFARIAPGFG